MLLTVKGLEVRFDDQVKVFLSADGGKVAVYLYVSAAEAKKYQIGDEYEMTLQGIAKFKEELCNSTDGR